jgi:hypothetical protein
MYWGSRGLPPLFLSSGLLEDEFQGSQPCNFYLNKWRYLLLGGWVILRAGAPTEDRVPDVLSTAHAYTNSSLRVSGPFMCLALILTELCSACNVHMLMKNGVFWDVTPCGSCKNRRFRGT